VGVPDRQRRRCPDAGGGEHPPGQVDADQLGVEVLLACLVLRLRQAGYRLAALTNSTEEVARAQLEHAGIVGLFEQVLSADTVRRLKPAPEPVGCTNAFMQLDGTHARARRGSRVGGLGTAGPCR
jgi:hypothetical protein